MTDLLLLAEAQIAEKQVKEIEEVKKRLEDDKKLLKEAIKLVNSHTLYKKVVTSNGNYKYVLATEEMLKADYLGEPTSYSPKGISFDYECVKATYNKGVMKVNGHIYYDIRYALNHYEDMVKDKERDLNSLSRNMEKVKTDLEELYRNFPTLKQAVTEWMEYQKKAESGGEE